MSVAVTPTCEEGAVFTQGSFPIVRKGRSPLPAQFGNLPWSKRLLHHQLELSLIRLSGQKRRRPQINFRRKRSSVVEREAEIRFGENSPFQVAQASSPPPRNNPPSTILASYTRKPAQRRAASFFFFARLYAHAPLCILLQLTLLRLWLRQLPFKKCVSHENGGETPSLIQPHAWPHCFWLPFTISAPFSRG